MNWKVVKKMMLDGEAQRDLDLFNEFILESNMTATDIIMNAALMLEWEAEDMECGHCVSEELIMLNGLMALLESVSSKLMDRVITDATTCDCEGEEDE